MTVGKWRSPEDGMYQARWRIKPTEPLGEHFESGRDVEIRCNTGARTTLRAYGELVEEKPAMECWLSDNMQHFLHVEAMEAITKLLSLSTQPVIRWRE